MLLAFAFITEEVRVFFQGMVITPEHVSLLELYVTTLVWLTPAILPFESGYAIAAPTETSDAFDATAVRDVSGAVLGMIAYED